MTLDELKAELEKDGIKSVGAMSRPVPIGDTQPRNFTIIFSGDDKVVFPFAMKTAYFLTLDSMDGTAKVHSEKYKALLRAIEADRKSGKLPAKKAAKKPTKKSN
jgi:hypothetical protein